MQQLVARLRDKETKLAKDKKGFTLVELIVVLVILAILAAILVPTLIGYINRANTEKDYSTAQTVRVAAQSVADEVYANQSGPHKDFTITKTSVNGGTTENDNKATTDYSKVIQLAGVSDSQVTDINFVFDANGKLTGDKNTVTINSHTYTYDVTKNSWSAQ